MYSAALLADVPEWAFDINIRAIAKHALHDWRCDFFYVKDFEKWPKSALQAYDVVFAPYHRWFIGNILP